MKIKDIANISSGLVTARKKVEFGSGYTYKILTLKSITEDCYVDVDEIEEFISNEHLPGQYLTRYGDVLIRLSYPNRAIYIDEELEGFIIPSLFAVIRLKDKRILPEFLAVYLNSENIKKVIKQMSIGSVVSIIKTSVIKEISIRKYTIEEQRKAIEFNALQIKEKKLFSKFIKEKENLNKAIMNELIK